MTSPFASRHVPWRLALVLLFTAAACADDRQDRPSASVDSADAAGLTEFVGRIESYRGLRQRATSGVPAVPVEATPEQIDVHQRSLGRAIADARANSIPGDLLTPPVAAIVRRQLIRSFEGPDGANIRASVMDENPVDIPLRVNQRYPDEVPLSTMPPEILGALPQLPDGLEYRFVGRHLVILDVDAHLVIDVLHNAIPG